MKIQYVGSQVIAKWKEMRGHTKPQTKLLGKKKFKQQDGLA